MTSKRASTLQIRNMKGKTPIVCLTAYTAPFAKIIDSYVDIILVGDSLGMVLYGFESTLAVTLDIMIAHAGAVTRSSSRACVVVDMPFGSYQVSKELAFKNAVKLMSESGCSAVKLEGGKHIADTVKFLVDRGIPVVGHIGLTPQSVHALGGYRHQGRNKKDEGRLIEEAKSLEEAGAFAIVLESIREPVARSITSKLEIPTIGIGASPSCDGQVLVTEDMTGLLGKDVPSFVKRYAELDISLEEAVKKFAGEVRNREFPTKEFCYTE